MPPRKLQFLRPHFLHEAPTPKTSFTKPNQSFNRNTSCRASVVRTWLPRLGPQIENKSPFPCDYSLVLPSPHPTSSCLSTQPQKHCGCLSILPLLQRALSGCQHRFLSLSSAAPRALAPCAAHLRLSHMCRSLPHRPSVAHRRRPRR
jgi:hypothetical protein